MTDSKVDSLATIRTHLANERTLLAYIRTGLGFMAAAALLIKIDLSENAKIISAILFLIGTVILIIGLFRYYRFKEKINR